MVAIVSQPQPGRRSEIGSPTDGRTVDGGPIAGGAAKRIGSRVSAYVFTTTLLSRGSIHGWS